MLRGFIEKSSEKSQGNKKTESEYVCRVQNERKFFSLRPSEGDDDDDEEKTFTNSMKYEGIEI